MNSRRVLAAGFKSDFTFKQPDVASLQKPLTATKAHMAMPHHDPPVEAVAQAQGTPLSSVQVCLEGFPKLPNLSHLDSICSSAEGQESIAEP